MQALDLKIASTMKMMDAIANQESDAKVRTVACASGTYDRQFKAEVAEQCLIPGASVSAIVTVRQPPSSQAQTATPARLLINSPIPLTYLKVLCKSLICKGL